MIASFDRLSDSIAGMRQSVSQMRMQRIDKLFAPLPRIVRDLAQDMGKKIAFQTSGGEVELDREMMENIRDPLIHIVRNAIDHGIEALEDRVAAGKDITATISVSARQSGNQIEIEIRDDGRGMSPDALVAKAIASRAITAAEARALSPKDKLELVFRPGFSTAAKITEVSGRGVGMDIVKANVEKIGGVVELRNDEGCGLSILLRVPMTLTIISGLMVRAHEIAVQGGNDTRGGPIFRDPARRGPRNPARKWRHGADRPRRGWRTGDGARRTISAVAAGNGVGTFGERR